MDNKNTFNKAVNQLELAEQQLAEENKMLAKLKGEEQAKKRDIETLEDEVKNQERLLAPIKEEILECQQERSRFDEEFADKEKNMKARLDARRVELETRAAQVEKEAAAREKTVFDSNRALKETVNQKDKELDDMRRLLMRMKEESEANFGKAVLKEREWTEMKKEVENAKAYIETLHNELKEKEQALLSKDNDLRARFAEAARADLGLTGQQERAHELLEKERQEFKEHYGALEKDFETKEKELMDEIRSLKEADTKKSLEYEKMSMNLAAALERKQVAESRASSASIEMMELNVYNKSAAAALREKDMEISDLKSALEEARATAGRSRP